MAISSVRLQDVERILKKEQSFYRQQRSKIPPNHLSETYLHNPS